MLVSILDLTMDSLMATMLQLDQLSWQWLDLLMTQPLDKWLELLPVQWLDQLLVPVLAPMSDQKLDQLSWQWRDLQLNNMHMNLRQPHTNNKPHSIDHHFHTHCLQ